MVAYM
jgi:hypothetical protein